MDITLSDMNELNDILKSEQAVILYFSSPSCNVCHVLRPKLMQAVKKEYPAMKRIHSDIALTPEVASRFQVFSAPTIIIFFEGREFIRKGRAVSIERLLEEIKRPYTLVTS